MNYFQPHISTFIYQLINHQVYLSQTSVSLKKNLDEMKLLDSTIDDVNGLILYAGMLTYSSCLVDSSKLNYYIDNGFIIN